ncbi:Hydroxyacylglutathione hydrolase GloC [Hydrogenovibrio crunogenus]|uniref:Hydroxyacylglutathione hydrolase GloC n=1 Tax=Hydrogenovibrio crunogenus TaxID=39765 RepID=A0A4P7NWU4_9GAMM|nr:MBL fold metallo-hydrolase [Hydrogenovibrio crunogenus]QBZ82056.1 Hydroxyacylglutathione hydrolase GloC [Hydrogenovibrio crunogenus]
MFLIQREVPSDPSSISYFMGCAGQGKSIAIDVHQDDVDWFIEQAKQKDVEINYVIDTHIHADHVSGAKKLAKRTGAMYCLHESAAPQFDFHPLKDQETFTAGNVSVEVLHTPGHTMDSICLLVTDLSRGPAPWFLISQHILFVGSVGRPDLRGREKEMAAHLYESIHSKILTLPDYVEILPGAKAGSVCGVGLSAKPVSTIGYEKANNSTLKLSRTAFIEKVLEELPPFPDKMDEIIQANIEKS